MTGCRRPAAPSASNGQARPAAAEPAANGRGAGDGVARIKRTMKAGTDGNEWGWQDYRGLKKAGREDRRLENKRRDPGSMEMKTLIQEGWKMNDRISASPGSGSAAGFGMAG
ncbi:MAG: hypothetical protein C6P37_15020 [Caldibacillus debilis]|uniref:Uncharacterized protein n=1 Tax=Caldibacillus debilis TaxID=301148 RepID=A0A3E0JY39_9BACI|nr:MAG: hypothetical protein C6P37_15020 [Caldibacillus debilis]